MIRMLRLTTAIAALLLLSACGNQPIKPFKLFPEDLKTQGVVFGSISYLTEDGSLTGNHYGSYTVQFESVDTGEVQEFSFNVLKFDEERDDRRKAIFLRQIEPGTYRLHGAELRSGYYPDPWSPASASTFTVAAGETVYLGNYRFEAVNTEQLSTDYSILSISNQLDRDLPLTQRLFPEIPEKGQIAVAPSVSEFPELIHIGRRWRF